MLSPGSGNTVIKSKLISRRMFLLTAAKAVVMVGLVGRLISLQINQATKYKSLSDKNRFREWKLAPERGAIKDFFNREIASNEPLYQVHLVPENAKDLDNLFVRLKAILNMPASAYYFRIKGSYRFNNIFLEYRQLGPGYQSFGNPYITNNVREMEGALNRLVAHATLVGTSITVETAQLVLQDLLKSSNKKITIEEIQKKVAEHFNIRITDMHSPRRSRSVARPRQIAMYLAKSITSRSLPEIGRKFGGRDHTTVMHAVKKIEELKLSDVNFNEDLELLKRLIDS